MLSEIKNIAYGYISIADIYLKNIYISTIRKEKTAIQ